MTASINCTKWHFEIYSVFFIRLIERTKIDCKCRFLILFSCINKLTYILRSSLEQKLFLAKASFQYFFQHDIIRSVENIINTKIYEHLKCPQCLYDVADGVLAHNLADVRAAAGITQNL